MKNLEENKADNLDIINLLKICTFLDTFEQTHHHPSV